jgi:ribosomal protein S1
MSRPDQDDWTAFVTRHATGGVLDGRVTTVMPFGAFVAVADGIEGLLPRPAWSAEPEPGSTIPVRIAAIDVERRRVSLVPA